MTSSPFRRTGAQNALRLGLVLRLNTIPCSVPARNLVGCTYRKRSKPQRQKARKSFRGRSFCCVLFHPCFQRPLQRDSSKKLAVLSFSSRPAGRGSPCICSKRRGIVSRKQRSIRSGGWRGKEFALFKGSLEIPTVPPEQTPVRGSRNEFTVRLALRPSFKRHSYTR